MMRWWTGATLALIMGASTLQAGEGLRAPEHPRDVHAVKKEKEIRRVPAVHYRDGVIPWRGARILGFTPTQVLETFDNGIDTSPTGLWESIVDGNSDGVTWDTAGSVGNEGPDPTFPNPPGAVYDDDTAGNGAPPGVEAITTKAIDFTMYQTGDTVLLSFSSIFSIYGSGGGEYAALAVQSFQGGSWGNWDTVWIHTGSDRIATELVDLSTYALVDSIKLSFAFVDTSGEWGWGWGIDDIALGTYSQQIFLNEDFEACNLPAGWIIQDGNGDGTTWTVGATGDLGSFEPPSFGTCYAYYSDDDAGSGAGAGEERLISPAVYVGGFSGLLGLSFGYGIRTYGEDDTLRVLVRAHDGTSWGTWTEVVLYVPDVNGTEDLDLSALLPAESVQVAFVYNDAGGWNWAVGVDNVMLYEITPPFKDVGIVSLDPGVSGIVPPSFTPTVVVKNYGATQQSYQVHFRIEDTQANVLFEDSTALTYRHSGTVDTVAFPAFTANVGDTLILTAWTDLADDNPSNDQLPYTVVVVNANDAAVTAVSGPAYGDPLFAYVFQVDVANVGFNTLSPVDVEVSFIDQATNTVVHKETLTVTTLDPQATTSLTTSPFQPPAENATYLVQAVNITADDDAINDTATFTFSTQIAPMGTELAAFTFPGLPTIYDLAGITYRDDNQKFYVVSMNTPGVYELDPVNGSLNFLFTTNNFGAPGGDIPWGIAFDPTDTTLWLTQIGYDNSGNVQYLLAVHYDFTGTVLNTVDLMALTGQGHIAGMDYFPRTLENGQLVGGYFWAVGVSDPTGQTMPNIWKLDLASGSVVAQLSNPDALSYRGVAYYARGVNLVFLGGWYQDTVQVWDSTLSSMPASYPANSVADFDLFEDLTHYQALIVQTHSDSDNTIRVVALGMPWQVDVNETPVPAVISFAPRGISRGMAVATLALPAATNVKAEVFDATGRRVAQVLSGKLSAGVHELRFSAPRTGLYFWKVKAGNRTFQAKTVVLK